MMLKRRLAAIVLATTLFSANTAMASVCEAYCAIVAKNNFGHHHPTAATFSSPHHHSHVQRASVDCPECLNSVGNSALHSPRCGMLAEVQLPQEAGRAYFTHRGALQPNTPRSSNGFWQGPIETEGFLPFQSPPEISSFRPTQVALRI